MESLPPDKQSRGIAIAYSGGSLGAIIAPLVVVPVAAAFGLENGVSDYRRAGRALSGDVDVRIEATLPAQVRAAASRGRRVPDSGSSVNPGGR